LAASTLALPLLLSAGLHQVAFRLPPEEAQGRLAAAGLTSQRDRLEWRHGGIDTVALGPPHAPPVLFVHGSPGGWDNWLDVVTAPELGARVRSIAYDRPGFGGSADIGVLRRLPDQAAVAARVLAGLGDGPAVVVGHSYGAPVAVQLALDRPELVAALVLVAGAVDPELETIRWYQALPRWRATRWLVPSDLARANDEQLPLAEELRHQRSRLDELELPVWAIHGERDPLVPVANLAYLQVHLPPDALHLRRVADLNHFIPWRRPDLIVAAVLEAVAGTSPAGEAAASSAP